MSVNSPSTFSIIPSQSTNQSELPFHHTQFPPSFSFSLVSSQTYQLLIAPENVHDFAQYTSRMSIPGSRNCT